MDLFSPPAWAFLHAFGAPVLPFSPETSAEIMTGAWLSDSLGVSDQEEDFQ